MRSGLCWGSQPQRPICGRYTESGESYRPGSDVPVIVVHRPETDVQLFCVPRGSEYHTVNALNVIAPYEYLGM
jgi:hypothetical protein